MKDLLLILPEIILNPPKVITITILPVVANVELITTEVKIFQYIDGDLSLWGMRFMIKTINPEFIWSINMQFEIN